VTTSEGKRVDKAYALKLLKEQADELAKKAGQGNKFHLAAQYFSGQVTGEDYADFLTSSVSACPPVTHDQAPLLVWALLADTCTDVCFIGYCTTRSPLLETLHPHRSCNLVDGYVDGNLVSFWTEKARLLYKACTNWTWTISRLCRCTSYCCICVESHSCLRFGLWDTHMTTWRDDQLCGGIFWETFDIKRPLGIEAESIRSWPSMCPPPPEAAARDMRGSWSRIPNINESPVKVNLTVLALEIIPVLSRRFLACVQYGLSECFHLLPAALWVFSRRPCDGTVGYVKPGVEYHLFSIF
jgi:hypothetical protein